MMMTLDEAIAFAKGWEGSFDGRDRARFAAFVPFDRIADAGMEVADGVTAAEWGDVKPWTEENVLQQLREDAKFGLEKAKGERGISSSCMFECVNMWCHMLRNGLEASGYSNYGRAQFERILDHYGWSTQLT